ncbi:hypothetical protein DSB74_26920, partial [Salmonella enterica subsp. enterica serovar Typhimurium]
IAGLFELLRPCYIDACASDENHLLPEYFTKQENCLQMNWKLETFFNVMFVTSYCKNTALRRNVTFVSYT